jgi:hypothetical protein
MLFIVISLAQINILLSVFLMIVSVLMIILLNIFFSAMDKIHKIILYIYEENGELPEFIDNQNLIKEAFVEKK